ncbi:MAG: DUF4388 domain-containing protein [Myxococcales bacterium]|nr:DUF4388 domain-containing protein [Myxococcales bacterium]MDP3501593.1 DUF4388 domain-containing protein [Myxococcales bacterium]
MAFHGDCSSYPVPELLQWLDASRKTGALHLTWESGERKLFLLGGQVVATAAQGLYERIARVLDVGKEFNGSMVVAALKAGQLDASMNSVVRQLAEEDLIGALTDVTATAGGRFHWTEDPDRGEDEWVSLELPLRHAVFESLKRLDESSEVERLLPDDTRILRGTQVPAPSHALHRVIVRLVTTDAGLPLGRLWLSLGLPRTIVGRAVFDLVRAGKVTVEGAVAPQIDPVADMLEQGAILLRERQFDAAALVFMTLLKSDPQDRRVRDFARMVEREHVASLYRELPPVARLDVHEQPELMQALRPDERQLVSQAKAGLDVSAIVLASGQKEVDALKLLHKLVRQGVLSVFETR